MSSDFRSIPPRLQIRERDNLEGKNPTVARSGMRTGVFTSSFDDTSIIIFDTITKGTFPQMLPVNSQYVSESYITGTMSVRKGVSDSLINFHRSTPGFGPFIENSHFEQSQDAFFLTSSDDSIFDEKLRDKVAIRIDISAAESHIFTKSPKKVYNTYDPGGRFYNTDITGFSYFNFARKKWEMIGLTDPETGGNLHFDTRAKTSTVGNSPIVSGTNHNPMQFVGYDGSWTATAVSQSDSAYNARKLIGSPTVTNFAPFANIYHATESQTLQISDYISKPFLLEKIVVNLPITAGRASDNPALSGSSNYARAQDDYVFFMYRQEQSYFVTKSNGGAISRHINRAKQEWATGSMRYIVCSGVMTFYNNLQSIASASNGNTPASETGMVVPIEWTPVNTPAFMHNFNVNSSNTTASNAASYTGSVQLNITPAVASPYMLTNYAIEDSASDIDQLDSPSYITHYWPGGTSCLPFGPQAANVTNAAGISGKAFSTYPGDTLETVYGWLWASEWKVLKSTFVDEEFAVGTNSTYKWYGAVSPNFKEAKQNQIEKLDQRTIRPLGGQQYGQTAVSGTSVAEQSSKTGYLLLPGDSFVIGIEAALGRPALRTLTSNAYQYGNRKSSITGSTLTVGNTQATITLYGSYIKDGKVAQQYGNQFLTSDSISETIGEDIGDQFIIFPREQWIGSYTDNVFSGTFDNSVTLKPSREILFSDTTFAKIVRLGGSITNFNTITQNYQYPGWPGLNNYSNITVIFPRRQQGKLNLFSSSEILYDSIVPNVEEYMITLGAVQTSSYVLSSSAPAGYHSVESAGLNGKFFKFPSTGFGGTTVTAQGNTYTPSIIAPAINERDVGYTNPYPFKTNPERRLADKEIYLICTGAMSSNPLALSNTDYFEWVVVNQDLVREILFTRGNVFTSTANGWNSANDTIRRQSYLSGSTQTKYGISSVKKQYAKQIYRHDRYGQFRDMLEGRKFTTFYDISTKTKDSKKSGVTGKINGPVTIRFWNREDENFSYSPSDSYLSGSSNRSIYATSSMPYVDGEYYNWGTVL